MSRLKILPSQIANMIAAGEVVQRPSSVVKELMENAVDAGADRIQVIISDAGRTLIQVIDNGRGMSPADAVLCFERHATSKIASEEDLYAIMSYGFRGEALASIAAVAEVTLKTRRAEDELACQVKISAGQACNTASVSAPVGSNFAVRNLFYNTPARRKFLKSDSIELKHIIEEFTHIAVTRPEIEFNLIHNSREIFVLKKAISLKYRISDLFSDALLNELVDISVDTSIINVRGFVGRPDAARKTVGKQYFFINGRYFRSPYLHKAVMKAYEELIPEGVTPSYFIFLEADPHSIDINIHPTKAEIKFEDESVVFQTLYACLKEAIGQHSFGASLDFDSEGAIELPVISKNFEQFKPITAPELHSDPNYDPFGANDQLRAESYHFEGEIFNSSHAATQREMPQEHSPAPQIFPEAPIKRQFILTPKHIITTVPAGIMVINITRARERILYDRFRRTLNGEQHTTQASLFPVQVNVGAAQRLLFDNNSELLSHLGFDISPLGVDSVVVNGVPEGYSCESGKVAQLVEDLVYILSDSVSSLPELMQQRMAEKLALLGASSYTSTPSPEEASGLIDTLFASDNAEFNSTGRRIVRILTGEDLDKLI